MRSDGVCTREEIVSVEKLAVLTIHKPFLARFSFDVSQICRERVYLALQVENEQTYTNK